MHAERRIVVFTGDPMYSVRRGIVDIDDSRPGLQWLVVWHSPRKSWRRLLRNQWANLNRNGWRWIPYQLANARRVLPQATGVVQQPGPGSEYTLDALRGRPNLQWLQVGDLHAAATLAAIRQFAPHLGLSLAAPILRLDLFALPELGTLNLHKGQLPAFRGMPPAFWEFWTGQTQVGCTVHWVDDKLDTGRIVAETTVRRAAHASVRSLQLQLDEVGAALMCDAVNKVLTGQASAREQPPHDGKTHRKPTLTQIAELRNRLAPPPPPWPAQCRHAAKELRATAAIGLVRSVAYNKLLAPRVTVLLYHRVSDDARDNLTVGVAQFEQHMALLRRHCRVLSIEQVMSMSKVPRSDVPLVAVTFDDGYLDNFVHAVPTLRRHALPAAFFVSTGIVASNNQFPHDLRRGNAPIAVMNWNQLRDMKRWGFTIGSHTVSHIDCASADAASVRWELAQSRDDLKRELGVEQPIFAYPYGGRQHMTAERLQWIRDAGYVGCLSAYGGSNIGYVDPYNVVRRGIHWEFSDRALRYACLGL